MIGGPGRSGSTPLPDRGLDRAIMDAVESPPVRSRPPITSPNDACERNRRSFSAIAARSPRLLLRHRPDPGIAGLRRDPRHGDGRGPAPVDFRKEVLPILSENCFLCHGPDSRTRKADLRLDVKEGALRTADPVIVPGKSGESELIRRVASKDADEVMPPPQVGQDADGAPDRAAEEVDRPGGDLEQALGVRAAAAAGAAAESRIAAGSEIRSTRFVLARLESERLAPTPHGREATLDPPADARPDGPAADSGGGRRVPRRHSPDAYEHLVDRLLASPHYGERMAMDWLDGARYADTNGFQNDFARTMWPWRDWVIAAFNRNQPFDRFVIEQIAGDLLPGATPGPADRHRLQPQQPDRHRGRLDRRGVSRRERRRPRRDHVDGLPRADHGLRPLPRPQVRPDLAGRVLPVLRLLQQRQRAGRLHRDARQRAPARSSCRPRTTASACGELEIAIAAAKASGDKAWIETSEESTDDYEKNITVGDGDGRSATARATRIVLKRGRYDMPDKTQEARAGRALVPAAVAGGRAAQSAGAGAMAGVAGEPADGPGRRQPDLAAPFRHGPGQDGRELRRPGRAAVASRAARLAGEPSWSARAGT